MPKCFLAATFSVASVYAIDEIKNEGTWSAILFCLAVRPLSTFAASRYSPATDKLFVTELGYTDFGFQLMRITASTGQFEQALLSPMPMTFSSRSRTRCWSEAERTRRAFTARTWPRSARSAQSNECLSPNTPVPDFFPASRSDFAVPPDKSERVLGNLKVVGWILKPGSPHGSYFRVGETPRRLSISPTIYVRCCPAR